MTKHCRVQFFNLVQDDIQKSHEIMTSLWGISRSSFLLYPYLTLPSHAHCCKCFVSSSPNFVLRSSKIHIHFDWQNWSPQSNCKKENQSNTSWSIEAHGIINHNHIVAHAMSILHDKSALPSIRPCTKNAKKTKQFCSHCCAFQGLFQQGCPVLLDCGLWDEHIDSIDLGDLVHSDASDITPRDFGQRDFSATKLLKEKHSKFLQLSGTFRAQHLAHVIGRKLWHLLQETGFRLFDPRFMHHFLKLRTRSLVLQNYYVRHENAYHIIEMYWSKIY